MPIFAMVAMSNHWHFVVWPTADDQVSEFFHLLTVMRYVERNPVRTNFVKLAKNGSGAPLSFAISQPANTVGWPLRSISRFLGSGEPG